MNEPAIQSVLNMLSGEKKITMEPDFKVPNAWSFTILKEDETISNMILVQLKKDKGVLFAGMKKSHPMWHNHTIRVQTIPDYTAHEAFQKALRWLMTELEVIITRFENALTTEPTNVPENK